MGIVSPGKKISSNRFAIPITAIFPRRPNKSNDSIADESCPFPPSIINNCGRGCSSCNKQLVDLFIVKKDDSLKWKTMAKCCYCNDKSFITEVNGVFRPCGIMEISETDPDESKMITELTNIKTENDIVVFYTVKAKR